MSSRNVIKLPQVNPGNVKRALMLLWRAKPGQTFSSDWLGDQGISQPNQTLTLLQFLGLLDESDRPNQAVIACRGNRPKFVEHIRASAIRAYGDEGFGSPGILAWLGRDPLTREELRKLVGDTGGFDVRALKRGGIKNAFYCLRALHELLVKSDWLRGPDEPKAEGRSVSVAKGHEPSENGDLAACEDDSQENQMIERRLSDSGEVRELLRGLLDKRPECEDTDHHDCIRVPVGSDDSGKTVWARVYFDGPERPRYLAELARLLQSMADGMQR